MKFWGVGSSQGMILFFKYVKPESLDIVNGKLPRRHQYRFAKKVPVLPHLVNNCSGSYFLLNSKETSTKIGASLRLHPPPLPCVTRAQSDVFLMLLAY